MSPLAAALLAVTESLRRCGVGAVRHSPSNALHRLSYDLAGETVGAVAWGEGLFIDPEIGPVLDALIRSHAYLACAHSPESVPLVPTYSPGCSGGYLYTPLED